jgi:hypothetical protein
MSPPPPRAPHTRPATPPPPAAAAPGPAGGEAAAELGEGGEVEPGVVELEPEGIFAVDAAADGVGGLAIGEVLGELHHGDQGELPRGQCGLPAPGVEVGEVGVAERQVRVRRGAGGRDSPWGRRRGRRGRSARGRQGRGGASGTRRHLGAGNVLV